MGQFQLERHPLRGSGLSRWMLQLAAFAAVTVLLSMALIHASDAAAGFATTTAAALLGEAGGGLPDASFMAALQSMRMYTQTPTLQVAEVCQQEHADVLGQWMTEQEGTNGWSSCHHSEWLQVSQRISDPSRNTTFIDIGCNKGYTSAGFFALWAPELEFTPKAMKKWDPQMACGSCGDCNEEIAPATQPPPLQLSRQVQVVCVEPNLVSYAQLIPMREHFFFNGSSPWAQWHLVNAAISNSSARTVRFPRCTAGSEECGFNYNSPDSVLGMDVVQLMTVDALFDMYDLQYVDILKIDTEGFDVPAIASAMASILAGKVGILQFEYHGLAAWSQHSLGHLVERLDGLNYVCYFSGKKGPAGSLARMTGCWSESYEFHRWSNVVCVRRDHELYSHAERLSTRYAKHRQLYYGEAAAEVKVAGVEAAAAAAH